MSEQAASISVESVTVRYSNGHTAIRDVSFTLQGGTTCALVGVNGSGKSTLFKSLMGQIKPKSGSIRLCGLPVPQALKRNLVAYVPQSEEVDWQFPVSVYDVVMQGRYGYLNFLRLPKAEDKRKVQEAMERVGIAHLAQRQIGELSGGQKKRVFLARALAQQARVILLDEPFTGVDVKTESAIIDLLRQLRDEGCVILVSTHNLGSVPEFCDRTALIQGTVLACGPTAEVFTRANLERAFGGVLRHFELPQAQGVGIVTDDERPLVLLHGRSSVRGQPDAGAGSAP